MSVADKAASPANGVPTVRVAAPSLHQRILGELEAKILSGEWPPGHRIPFEHELTTAYGCSRMTVNKVMTQLAQAGLIERRRRAGSFVTRPHSQSAVLQIQDLETEVAALGRPYRFAILTRRIHRRFPKILHAGLRFEAVGPVLDLDCCHFAGQKPFCFEERVIGLAAVPEAETEPFATTPPGTWLARRVPWTSAEHTIRAAGADAVMAGRLQMPEGTPCLVMERRTWSAERAVTAVRFTYPGTAHELVARFSPNQARDDRETRRTRPDDLAIDG